MLAHLIFNSFSHGLNTDKTRKSKKSPSHRQAQRKDADSPFVYSDPRCVVSETANGQLELHFHEDWSPGIAKVVKRFGIRRLDVMITPRWKDQSLDFLAGLPDLIALTISTQGWLSGRSLAGWNRIESLSKLEELSLSCNQLRGEPCAIDFTRLARLTLCRISWETAWASVVKAKQLRELAVGDEANALRELDCSALAGLETLTLGPCFALKTLTLADAARVSILTLGGAPKLQPDWRRLGRDLEKLTLNGKVGFPLEELRAATGLRRLYLLNTKPVRSLSSSATCPPLSISRFLGQKCRRPTMRWWMKSSNDSKSDAG